MKFNNKLNYKFLGLFYIIKKLVNTNYELDLPLEIKLNLVFHIEWLQLVLLNIKLETNIELTNKLLEYEVRIIIDLR